MTEANTTISDSEAGKAPAVHLILQGKGGVGKSVVASWLAEFLMKGDKSVCCIDGDPVNRSLGQYKALRAEKLDLVNQDGLVQRTRYDSLLERFATENIAFVVDSGATAFMPFWTYLIETEMTSVLRQVGRPVYVHVPISGGEMLNDTLLGFKTVAESITERSLVLWINEYFGPVARDGKCFEQMQVYLDNQDKVLGSVGIPQRSPDTYGGSVHFPYDWRKSLRCSADLLRDTILRTYSDYGKRVHLVGHSMGGLMIRTALMMYGRELWPRVERIVFIGTPHYGSPSIAGYLKNHLWGWEEIAVLSMFLSRETFRTLRGVLSLLPAPVGVYPGTRNGEDHPCANFDIYDADAWKLDLSADATVHLQSILDEVRQYYRDMYQWHDSLRAEQKERMLMIAGVGQETLFRLEFDSAFWGVWKHTKKITDRITGNPNRDGDGRVPLASALLEDVTTRFIEGEHGGLPNIPAVAQDVLAWLTEDKLKLPVTPQGALGGHLSAEDENSAAPLLDGSGGTSRFRDLPDYEHPTPEFRARIAAELDAGRMPQVNLVKIL